MKLQIIVSLQDTINQNRDAQGALAGYLEDFAAKLRMVDVPLQGVEKRGNDSIEWFYGKGDFR